MKKTKFVLLALLSIALFAFACDDTDDPEKTYTVTFDSQGGSAVDAQTVTEKNKVTKPEDPTKEGHTFAGWYKESSFVNAWSFDSDIVENDIILYAYWIPESVTLYTITFDTGEGSVTGQKQVPEGEKISRPEDPTLDMHTFEGWYKDPEFENIWDFDNDIVISDMTLYANWTSEYVNTYFVATDGDDSNPGTFSKPFATLNKALEVTERGTTIYMRGGTYTITEDQITTYTSNGTWAYVFDLSAVSGTQGEPIRIWGFEGERPVLDLSQVRPADRRVIVFYVNKHWYHFKNFEIVGTQVTILGHTQSECFRNDGGNNNIYENLSMHDGMAIGFYLTRGLNNLVLNCDAYNNYDDYSEGTAGGNVDGFGAHVPNANHTGNVFRGCRAWWNSDDGFDLINAYGSVTIENCWSFYNGYQPGSFTSAGDGAGFKSGGYGMGSVVTTPSAVHTVKGCLAYYNKNQGFYANHHLGGIRFFNNTGYKNPSNFNMLNRLSPDIREDDPDGGYGHVIKNNLSFEPRRTDQHIINVNEEKCEIGTNSFMSTISVTADDFISLDESQLTAPRQADGSLPRINFLRPVAGSQLIGAGESLGVSYTGTTLGCFQQ